MSLSEAGRISPVEILVKSASEIFKSEALFGLSCFSGKKIGGRGGEGLHISHVNCDIPNVIFFTSK